MLSLVCCPSCSKWYLPANHLLALVIIHSPAADGEDSGSQRNKREDGVGKFLQRMRRDRGQRHPDFTTHHFRCLCQMSAQQAGLGSVLDTLPQTSHSNCVIHYSHRLDLLFPRACSQAYQRQPVLGRHQPLAPD